jgi:hypothetical protein
MEETATFDASVMADVSPFDALKPEVAPAESAADVKSCQPKSCQDLGYDCGANSDGCGQALQCGSCVAPLFCGGGGFSKCGGAAPVRVDASSPCVPRTCKDMGFNCGGNSDGCAGLVDCGSCSAPDFCGGGGFSVCGHLTLLDGGVAACIPRTCAQSMILCGPAGDGCGGVIDCGTGFNLPEPCGSGPPPPNSVPSCTPQSCQQQNIACGFAGDGCGKPIDCGPCPPP